MKQALYRLIEHQFLTKEEAKEILLRMTAGAFNEAQVSAFITIFLMRSISVDELAGFRDALLELCTPLDFSAYNPIDIVGTGGDNKNTFNVSTAASFVVAGAGYKVVKHGNYGATSVSGASNVMEAHGVKFTADQSRLTHSLETCNMAYLHAPLFNPAMKQVAPVRKALGVRTFFNMLGPLVNPSTPQRQLLGVYNLKLARLYNYLYQQTAVDFSIVHTLDGYDEISLTDAFKVITRQGERLYTPEQIGLKRCTMQELDGGTSINDAKQIFDAVLRNEATAAQTNCVIVNAAFAIQTIDTTLSIEDCIATARESIESHRAESAFKQFITLNN